VAKTYVATGNLRDGRVVELDEPLPVANTKVRVRIEPLPSREVRPLREVLAEIHAQQDARGFVPPTREEVDRYLESERENWDR
jgi:hypothetical protein